MSNILDNNNDNLSVQQTDKDSDNDLQSLGTQATNFIDENSKNSQVHHYSSAQDESTSDSDDLEDIDQLASQSIPLCLISLS